MSAELLLHWQLDHVAPDGVLLDSSPGARTGHVEGQPSAQPDERFGSCLALNGHSDALVTAAAPALRLRTYTIAVWAQLPAPDPAPTRAGPRVLAAQTGGPSMAISPAGAFVHEVVTGSGKRLSLDAPVGSLNWSAWHHLAITRDGSTARAFVDGSQIAQWTLGTGPANSQGDLIIGADPLRTTHTAGRFAHLRVYTDTLTKDELRRDMADDQAALTAFVRTHPLEIELTNVNDQPVLFIDDGPATQQLTLRLTNSSRQDMELRPGTGPVSAHNRHIALLFRPGTLVATAAPATPAPGWTIQRDLAGTTLYLLHSDTSSTRDTLTIGRGGWLEVPITGLNADGAGGSRGTRVEAQFGQLGYAGEQDELTGSRLLFLDVVNHRGRPDIPLDVSFVGGDRVLSDGLNASTLRIGLFTVSRDTGLALTGRATAGDAASAFVVSFEVQLANGESREWALTTSGTAGDATKLALPATGVGSDWVVTPDDLGQRRRWILTPRTDTAIPADGHVELALSEIHALAAPGHAPIIVEYQNIPGYQDGFVSLTAERTPLLFSASTVGIGQAAGTSRLTISADSGHLQLRREPKAPGIGAQQYLELFQDEDATAPRTGPTFPCIGFNHSGRFVHRIEARPEGITFKDGPVTSDALLDVYAGRLVLARSQPGGIKLHLKQPLTTPALTVGAESAHVQLRRESKVARTGTQLYLELYQDQPPEGQVTFPSIRFHQENKFWHRIEGRPEGFAFKDGDLDADALVDVYAARAVLGTLQPGIIGQTTPPGQTTAPPAGLTISANSGHLQLRRETNAAGTGKQIYLELFQNDTPGDKITLPSIRFHHSNKFWHRIEGRPEGFAFTDGNLNSDSLTNITANTATLSSLHIGSITIGENELRILQLLANGQLTFDLLNASQNQYVYVTDYGASGDRWNVFGWRPGDRVTQGVWRIVDPRAPS